MRAFYGSNASYQLQQAQVELGPLTLYYCYGTPIAFQHKLDGDTLVTSVNYKGTTSLGLALNSLEPDKTKRLPREVFLTKLSDILRRHNLC